MHLVLYTFTVKEIDTKSFKKSSYILKNSLTTIEFITHDLGIRKAFKYRVIKFYVGSDPPAGGSLVLVARDCCFVEEGHVCFECHLGELGPHACH